MPRLLPANPRIKPWPLERKNKASWANELQDRRRGRVNLSKGLVAYWKLNEAAGTTRNDSTSNALHLTDFNTVGQVAGKIQNAADFSNHSLDRWLERADSEPLRFTGDFTISAWVYRTGDGFGHNSFVTKTNAFYFHCHDSVGFKSQIWLYDPIGAQILNMTSSQVVPTNTWTHLVITRRDTVVNLFHNNGPPDIESFSGIVAAGAEFRIGAQNAGGYPFTGYIDEVGKWNRALSRAEISVLHNVGSAFSIESF